MCNRPRYDVRPSAGSSDNGLNGLSVKESEHKDVRQATVRAQSKRLI
jgi:hypothetical protein